MTPALLADVEAAAALHQAGRLDEAVAAYQGLLGRPDAPRETLLQLLALAHVQAARPGLAIAAYDALLAISPGRPETLEARAIAHAQLGASHAALADLDAAVAVAPDRASAWWLRSAALRRLGRPREALESAERALALQPGSADAHNDRALALMALDRFGEALEAHETALALRPGDLDALNGAGLALGALGRLEAAQARYETALRFASDHAPGAYNLALLKLRRGDQDGWRGHEHRWRRPGQAGPTYPDATLWLGTDDIAGKTLLLHAEQGLGDTIQFCRYAPLARAAGARVVLEVQPSLVRLMRGLDGVDAVVPIGPEPPAFDRHTPLMSLPLAFAAPPDDARVPVPYLKADPHLVAVARARLPDARLRVGLVWAGATAHENDRHRSIPLAMLDPLVRAARAEGVAVVALQTPLRDGDAAQLRDWGVADLGATLDDFADTAAVLAALDLTICVDTSVAHLAGALGRPAWLLLPAYGDWRWMDARTDSPWYRSLRLFRQPALGRWDTAIAVVSQALAAWSPA